jgi:hypothetical protein
VLVAKAVAKQARDEGLCEAFPDAVIAERIERKMWTPAYPCFRARRADEASRSGARGA